MRRLLVAVTAAVCLTAAAGCSGSGQGAAVAQPGAAHQGTAGPRYYLALGDSLARGVQPDARGASVSTSAGYPDQLVRDLDPAQPGLRLVDLGCSGETTSTMIHGGICHYRGGSQLAAAERFLRARRHRMTLVTIDIGANDPNSCFYPVALSRVGSCTDARVRMAVTNLGHILAGLRAAGGPGLRIIGMTYYVPELAGWLHGTRGREIAVLTERLVKGYNALLSRVYRRYRAGVADVFGAFRSADFGGPADAAGGGSRPPNVAAICRLTWACTRPPRGPNEHANRAGYAVIARAFLRADRGQGRVGELRRVTVGRDGGPVPWPRPTAPAAGRAETGRSRPG